MIHTHWIKICTPFPSPATIQAYSMGSRKKSPTVAQNDGYAYICAICNDFGELVCCEQCGEGFHLRCLNLDSLPDETVWLCNDCKNNKVRCFECKQVGNRYEGTVLKCLHKTCRKFYHRQCVMKWKWESKTKRGFRCPHHICDACGRRKNSGQWKLFRCFECPMAYHENCCPDGCNLLEDISGFMICWRHEDSRKCQPPDKKIESPAHLFETFPIPENVLEFHLPRVFHDFVKKLKDRPQPFVHIRRNVYLVKKPKKRLEEKYMHCSCAESSSSTETCEKDCICSMLQYSCSESCGCGTSCTNLPFQKRPGRKLQLVKTEKCGWGLVAAENIKAGDFIIEYVGEVIDDKECGERLWGMKEQGESNFYMCEINREMVIDATFKGNVSRFINHSCSPNTELQKWQIEEEIRIGVFAISDIKVGDTISYDYQFIPFGQEQECFCGSASCRGILGKKHSKQKLSSTEALEIVAREVLMAARQAKKSKMSSMEIGHSHTSIHQISLPTKIKLSPIPDSKAMICSSKERSTVPGCVGLRVQIWWPVDKKFYCGKIVDFDNEKGLHKIQYDDGEIEVLDMSKEEWKLEGPLMPRHKIRHQEERMKPYVSEESHTSAQSEGRSSLQLGGSPAGSECHRNMDSGDN